MDEKEKQKRSTKQSRSTHYPIQDYLEDYLDDDVRIENMPKNLFNDNKRRNKIFSEKERKNNNSLSQLINLSDGEG